MSFCIKASAKIITFNSVNRKEFSVNRKEFSVNRKEFSHSHIEAQVLFLLKEEVQHELPDEVGVQAVINHLRPPKLHHRYRPFVNTVVIKPQDS